MAWVNDTAEQNFRKKRPLKSGRFARNAENSLSWPFLANSGQTKAVIMLLVSL
jgi:hypothetical protein